MGDSGSVWGKMGFFVVTPFEHNRKLNISWNILSSCSVGDHAHVRRINFVSILVTCYIASPLLSSTFPSTFGVENRALVQ